MLVLESRYLHDYEIVISHLDHLHPQIESSIIKSRVTRGGKSDALNHPSPDLSLELGDGRGRKLCNQCHPTLNSLSSYDIVFGGDRAWSQMSKQNVNRSRSRLVLFYDVHSNGTFIVDHVTYRPPPGRDQTHVRAFHTLSLRHGWFSITLRGGMNAPIARVVVRIQI